MNGTGMTLQLNGRHVIVIERRGIAVELGMRGAVTTLTEYPAVARAHPVQFRVICTGTAGASTRVGCAIEGCRDRVRGVRSRWLQVSRTRQGTGGRSS